ncbi:hypothetical protein BVRB_4g076530 [Beta vulgaris subsp. vulgaris]|nr:hypothetical protein BVRB_4g076530 [Beta vulgaris subsp. vulgaris]
MWCLQGALITRGTLCAYNVPSVSSRSYADTLYIGRVSSLCSTVRERMDCFVSNSASEDPEKERARLVKAYDYF